MRSFSYRCGMINATIPVYQAEISPPESRGRLVSTHGIFLVTGYVSSYTGLDFNAFSSTI